MTTKPSAKSKKTKSPSAKTSPAAKTRAKAKAKTKVAAKPGSKAKPASTTPTRTGNELLYWLFKSEPDVFSWDDLVAKDAMGEEWDGVRNYQARNNMRAMKRGDLGFFYHSNIGLQVVGVCMVSAEAHPDSTTDDDRWECVDVRAVCPLPQPVTLADVKATPELGEMSLVTSMRLSVQPVTQAEWNHVCKMGGLTQKALKEALSKVR